MTRSLAEVTRDLAMGGFPPMCEAPGHAHPAEVSTDRGWRCIDAARWGDDGELGVKIRGNGPVVGRSLAEAEARVRSPLPALAGAIYPPASLSPEPGVGASAPGLLSPGPGPSIVVDFSQGPASRSRTTITPAGRGPSDKADVLAGDAPSVGAAS